MPIYNFKAIDKNGKRYGGSREASDKFVLYQTLKREGETVLSAEEQTARKSWNIKSMWSVFSSFSSIKTHDKIIFAKNLGTMIEAGLSVTRSLNVMEKQARNSALKKILVELGQSISKGTTLNKSMEAYPKMFSQLFISMVKAGEESGNLASSLKIVASQMDKSFALQRKIRGAMMYPAIILFAMVIIGMLMLIFIVPTITATFQSLGVDLPLSTRIIIKISDFIRGHYLISLLGLLIFGTSLGLAMRTRKGKRVFDYIVLRIPVISPLIKEINSARTTRTLSSLLTSGVDMVVAIGITKDVIQNSYYKDVLIKAEAVIQKGENMSSVFSENENLYPIFVSEMTNVGEETGRLSEMLMNVASFYEEDVDQKTKDMSTIIEPFLMVFMGIVVGLFAISMLAPTYSLVDKI